MLQETADIVVHPLPVGPAEGPVLPEKRDSKLVKESEDVGDCAAPCDFYIRSTDEEDVAAEEADGSSGLADLWLSKKSDNAAGTEEDAAEEADVLKGLAELWLAKKSDDVADTEDCAAPCDFYI